MLKLKRFRVTGFRSVHDSGWIEVDDVTALIGVNESGKSNLLLPLWKLNPVKGGEISLLADYPRSHYASLKNTEGKSAFITADFEADSALRAALAERSGVDEAKFKIVRVERWFNGGFNTSFPNAGPETAFPKSSLEEPLLAALAELPGLEGDPVLRAAATEALKQALGNMPKKIDSSSVSIISKELAKVPSSDPATPLSDRWATVGEAVKAVERRLTAANPNSNVELRTFARSHMPKFVYYSQYGNLDSEIYLPHVLDNLKRTDLGAKEAAKVRTLKVLFDYVGLKPEEILELGQAAKNPNGAKPTAEQIDAAAQRTKERSVLLQSAGTKLTKDFREWWKQGDYRFRLQADGDHFRIWVSDDKRPEEIELEARSTGLQWFISFFLVFLVESDDEHDKAVLLLDEPGLTLHPLAQRDLSGFFDGLSNENQLLYTTHSPFLLDSDSLDRVRNVYVDETGATAVSADLRAGAKVNSPEARSVYAVHAALGLSVSEALLQGCNVVLVEGSSDQIYLSAIKTTLVGLGRLKPRRELLFPPCSGAKGVMALIPLVTAKDEVPPYVLFDSDEQGRAAAKSLRSGAVYGGESSSKLVLVGELLSEIENAEVEDLLPHDLMVAAASRLFRAEDEDFADVADGTKAFVPQLEAFAKRHGLPMVHGWKVDLARLVKQRMLKQAKEQPAESVELWIKLFKRIAP